MYTFLNSLNVHKHPHNEKLNALALFPHLVFSTHFRKKNTVKDVAFERKRGEKSPIESQMAVQNKMKPGSVEIEHECENPNRKAQSRRQHFKGHLAPSGIVRVNLLPRASGPFILYRHTIDRSPKFFHLNHRCWGLMLRWKLHEY